MPSWNLDVRCWNTFGFDIGFESERPIVGHVNVASTRPVELHSIDLFRLRPEIGIANPPELKRPM